MNQEEDVSIICSLEDETSAQYNDLASLINDARQERAAINDFENDISQEFSSAREIADGILLAQSFLAK